MRIGRTKDARRKYDRSTTEARKKSLKTQGFPTRMVLFCNKCHVPSVRGTMCQVSSAKDAASASRGSVIVTRCGMFYGGIGGLGIDGRLKPLLRQDLRGRGIYIA